MELFHCFGAIQDHRVDTRQALAMLDASGCRYLAVNTHNVDAVHAGDELPIGYSRATLGSVSAGLGAASGVRPVLNINHPTSAGEAVDRARKAVTLTGIGVIKLEVLDDGLAISRNEEVTEAAVALIGDGLEVWPLITPDPEAFRSCVAAGSTMVRVMGSPIGSRRGIEAAWLPVIEGIMADSPVPIMLDGGVASVEGIYEADALGFDAVLVNSCLFGPGAGPVAALREFRTAVDAVNLAAAVAG